MKGHLWCRLAVAALLLLPVHAVQAQEPAAVVRLASVINPEWAQGEFWSDGKAEVARYHGERIVYGEPRPHELHLITVTEDFNREYWAKADWPYGQKPLLPVVKQNQNATIETPNYPYHYMTSVFFERARIGNAVKMTVSSQEWCGSTFKEFQLHAQPVMFRYSSYWDGQGTGEATLPAHDANTHFEEELPLLVRTLRFRDGLAAALLLQPNQTTNKAPVPEASPAILNVAERLATWRVTIEAQDGRKLVFDVKKEYPNHLVAFEHSDGRHYELAAIERRAYWELPGN